MTSRLDTLRDQLVLAIDAAGLREVLSEEACVALVTQWCWIAELDYPVLDTTPAGRGR